MFIGRKVYGVAHLLEILALGGVAKTIALRLDVIGIGLDDAGGKRRVVEPAVITLGVVLDRHLPVAFFIDLDGLDGLQAVDLGNIGTQLGLNTGVPVLHRLGIVIEIDKNEPAEFLGAHRGQADLLSDLSGHHFGIRPTQKMPVQMIGPCMIGTDQRLLALTLSFYQLMGAVLADVIKRTQNVLVVADTKERLSCDLKTEVIPELRHL